MPRAKRALVFVHSYYLRDTRPRRHATALRDAGWEVDVICARDEGEVSRERVGGVRIYRLPARRLRGSRARYVFEYVSFALMGLVALTAVWLRRRHRVVYVIGIPNAIVFAAAVPRLLGARVLLDMRDPLPEFFQAKYALADDHPLVRLLLLEEKLSCRFASAVLTVVPSMARLYERAGVRATVIMNAPDPRLFAAGAPVAADAAHRTMLYTGTVARRYGVDLAVSAVARLREEVPNLRLRIVGDGDLVSHLRHLARAEGIEERVIFDPPVPLDRIPEIVQGSWLGVQPNRDDPLMRHSLSTKVLEWCRLGLPVVAGVTRPLADLFTADELLLHPPGDLDQMCERIREAARDPDALRRRVERARAAAERVRYEEEIGKLLAVFDEPPPARSVGARTRRRGRPVSSGTENSPNLFRRNTRA